MKWLIVVVVMLSGCVQTETPHARSARIAGECDAVVAEYAKREEMTKYETHEMWEACFLRNTGVTQ